MGLQKEQQNSKFNKVYEQIKRFDTQTMIISQVKYSNVKLPTNRPFWLNVHLLNLYTKNRLTDISLNNLHRILLIIIIYREYIK